MGTSREKVGEEGEEGEEGDDDCGERRAVRASVANECGWRTAIAVAEPDDEDAEKCNKE